MVESLQQDFVPGVPWKGKEDLVTACGYSRVDGTGKTVPEYGAFHEAYEDARMFSEMFAEELSEATEDPQELFSAFFYVREETLFVDDVEEYVRTYGIDSILERREEILEDELRRCSDPDDL